MTVGPEEFAERRVRAAEAAKAAGLDGLLICARGGGTLDRYGDVLYLTNHYTQFPYIPDLPGQWTARAHTFVVLPADGAPMLIRDVPDDGRIQMPEDQQVYTDLVLEETVAALRQAGLDKGKVGLVGGDVLPVTTFRALCAELPDVDWPDAQAVLSDLRKIKSPGEIAMLRRAAQVGSRTIEAMMEAAKPGATHGEVVAAGQAVLNAAGGALYNSFMASGTGGPEPVLIKSNFPTWGSTRPLEEGHWLRLGISGVVDGYVFDVSRSRAIGNATNAQIAAFEAAIEVVEAGIAAIRPGAKASDLAAAGKAKQQELDFPLTGVFSGLGHGIGMGWDSPWIAPGDETEIQPGMVLNFEKTLTRDGYLGDFEETVVVTEDGIEKLTDARIRWW